MLIASALGYTSAYLIPPPMEIRPPLGKLRPPPPPRLPPPPRWWYREPVEPWPPAERTDDYDGDGA